MVSGVLVLSTMETMGARVLVTTEEVMGFWYLMAYSGVRFLIVIIGITSRIPHTTIYSSVKNGDYHNLLVCSLQLLACRIHLTMSTPYSVGIAVLVGARLFWKLEHGDKNNRGSFYIIIADALLMYTLCLACILPLFASVHEGYAVVITIMFACISIARIIPTPIL